MDYQKIKEALGWIGDKLGIVTQKSISWLSKLGIDITDTQSKILNLIVIGIFLLLAYKVINFPKKLIKWGIIILAIVLILSIIISLF